MLRHPVIKVPIYVTMKPKHVAFSKDVITAGVTGLMAMNMVWLNYYGKATPPLYRSGVRYVPEHEAEEWQTIPEVWSNKAGDCEDLAAWRCAELRIKEGIPANIFVRDRRMPDGTMRAHVMVQHPNGFIEDPSAKLGMYSYGRRD